MSNIVPTKIKLRKDTLENWNNNPNVILLDGEVAIVVFSDSSIGLKIGDGTATFNSLDYILFANLKTNKISSGNNISNTGSNSNALGTNLNVSGNSSIVSGVCSQSSENYTFTWNGDPTKTLQKYVSHGCGTFNINPQDGIDGIYIGEISLKSIIEDGWLSDWEFSSNPRQGYVYKIFINYDESAFLYERMIGDDSPFIMGDEIATIINVGTNPAVLNFTTISGDNVIARRYRICGKLPVDPEDTLNKVTSFQNPTDTQYPSAKLVNDELNKKLGPYPFVDPTFTHMDVWTVSPQESDYDLVPDYRDNRWYIDWFTKENGSICDSIGPASEEYSAQSTSFTLSGYTATKTILNNCILKPFANNQIKKTGGWLIPDFYTEMYGQMLGVDWDDNSSCWRYLFEYDAHYLIDANDPNATVLSAIIDGETVTVTYIPSTFKITIDTSTVSDVMRDLYFIIKTDSTIPNITWDSSIDRFPNNSQQNVVPIANSTNIYHIFEYENGKFAVELQDIYVLNSSIPVESGTGNGSLILKNSGAIASGNRSVSLGTDNNSGSSTLDEGEELKYSKSEGYGAFSEGAGYAKGDYSHAEGGGNSIAVDHPTVPTAEGKYSHAEGTHTYAKGDHSHAEGNLTIARNRGSHAEGYKTEAKGGYSHAEGVNTYAEGGAHAEGGVRNQDGTTVNGGRASGISSHAEGQLTESSGETSHAEGNSTKSIGASSHSEGSKVVAKGNRSHAEGNSSNLLDTDVNNTDSKILSAFETSHNFSAAVRVGAHSEGWNTLAYGNASHSEGRETCAKGDYSHAEGQYTVASNTFEHAEGKYNVSHSASSSFGDPGNTISSIGIGPSASTRKNAFEVMQNGKVFVKDAGGYNGTNPTESGVKDVATMLSSITTLDNRVLELENKLGDLELIISGV